MKVNEKLRDELAMSYYIVGGSEYSTIVKNAINEYVRRSSEQAASNHTDVERYRWVRKQSGISRSGRYVYVEIPLPECDYENITYHDAWDLAVDYYSGCGDIPAEPACPDGWDFARKLERERDAWQNIASADAERAENAEARVLEVEERCADVMMKLANKEAELAIVREELKQYKQANGIFGAGA